MKWSSYLLVIAAIVGSLFLLAPGGAKNGHAGDKAAMDTAGKTVPGASGFRKPDDATLRQRLTPLQYEVTQQDDTERPFRNEYWDNKRAGIYVDIVSGEPLFSSTDKFKSGTGWPSFTRPIEAGVLMTHEDTKFFMKRTELRSKLADSHLGHLFDDGPEPTGQRYCINSASLRFIPKEDLEKEGYANFLSLFEPAPGKPSDQVRP